MTETTTLADRVYDQATNETLAKFVDATLECAVFPESLGAPSEIETHKAALRAIARRLRSARGGR